MAYGLWHTALGHEGVAVPSADSTFESVLTAFGTEVQRYKVVPECQGEKKHFKLGVEGWQEAGTQVKVF